MNLTHSDERPKPFDCAPLHKRAVLIERIESCNEETAGFHTVFAVLQNNFFISFPLKKRNVVTFAHV